MSVSRRSILVGGAAGVGSVAALAVAGTIPSLSEASASPSHSPGHGHGKPKHPKPTTGGRPFPPLQDDPNGILALPAGFSYTIVTNAVDLALASGTKARTALSGSQGLTPSNADGTAVVASGWDGYTLIQNHELRKDAPAGVPNVTGTVYDALVVNGGGCTVINTDRDGNLISESVGISGTLSNCAGGPTPWGTWLTCEETDQKAAAGSYEKDHGYVFEVFADGKPNPTPLKALGRFAHEAVAVEPKRNRIFLTEDASGPTGLVYRWTAPKGVKLGKGLAKKGLADAGFGTFEAMQILLDDGSVLSDVAYITSAQLGRPFKVTWTPVQDRDATTTSVRKQFADGTVTHGKKFEGIWSDGDKGAYIVNSYAFGSSDLPADATKHDGMVWFYDFDEETITLVTYFPHNPQSEDEGVPPKFQDLVFDGPDNVSVTPWGTLILAEDGARASHVLSAVPGGPAYAIARNMLANGDAPDGSPTYSEFTGPTFSPDGKVLFVNIQVPGITLAITGPWQEYLD